MKAIKKVPTALFENDDGKYPWEDAGGSSSSPQKSGNIYDILDEVLQTPSPPRGGVGDSESYDGDEQFLPRSVSPHGTAHSSALNLQSGSQGLMSLADVDRSLRESVSPPPPEYSQEMDWMPTQSKWRAFDSASATGREGQRFGAAPVARRGPFWYRVPDAPTTPAQRLRNPPNKPQIRTSPAQAQAAKKEPLFPRAGPDVRHSDGGLFSTANGNARQGLRDVEFAQPRFFASQDEHVAGLADALSRSFTISDDGMVGDDGSDSRRPTMTASPRLGLSFYSSSRGARLFQLALLVGALAAWLELMQLEQQQQTEQLDQGSRWWFASHVLVSSTITTSAVRLVLLTLTAILAVRAAAETVTDMGRRTRAQQQQQGPGGGGGSGDGGIGDTGISTLALIFLAVAQVALALYAAARILSDMEWVGTTPLPPISNVDSDGYETSEVLVDVGVGNGLAGAGSMGPIAAAVPACDAGCLIQGAWLIGTVAMHEAWNALAGSA